MKRTESSNKPNIEFEYDAMGNRIAKHVKPKNSATHSTYYVRDAQGNLMATYSNSTETITLEEQPIYGSARLGTYSPTEDAGIVRGLRTYEATNHLGNVLTTYTDRIILTDDFTYTPEQTTATDYYPFGMPMPGRSFSMMNYRYGFNGQEKVNEVYGEGKAYDLGLRMYDARIVRMFKIDPRSFEYPWQSTYVYHRNSPISVIDFLGGGDNPNPNDEDNFTGFGDDKVGTTASPIEISAVTITPEQSFKNQQSKNFEQQNEDYLKLRGQYNNSQWQTRNALMQSRVLGQAILYQEFAGNYNMGAADSRHWNGFHSTWDAGFQAFSADMQAFTNAIAIAGSAPIIAVLTAPIVIEIASKLQIGLYLSGVYDFLAQAEANNYNFREVNYTSILASAFVGNPFAGAALGSFFEITGEDIIRGTYKDNTIFGDKSFFQASKETVIFGTTNYLGGRLHKSAGYSSFAPQLIIQNQANYVSKKIKK